MTTKLGSSDKRPGTASASVAVPSCRLYMNEVRAVLAAPARHKFPGCPPPSRPAPACPFLRPRLQLAFALFTWVAGFYALFARTTHLGLAIYLVVQGECGAG